MATIWGDPEKGAHATFTKFKPGYEAGEHTHTNDVSIVVIKGAYLYKDAAGEKRVGPGDFLKVPGGHKHSSGGDKTAIRGALRSTVLLDQLLILHADHEQNCSTSTVRIVGSRQANLFASVAAGINALSGPLHGGANQAVLEMLQEIQRRRRRRQFVKRVKNKEHGVKLMGFGHRVYKNYDPRAAIIKKTADEMLDQLGVNDALLDIAMQLEEMALADDYFVERKLYPNVDFYTGLIYKAMGFPTEMFTVLFALGRLPGWIAQWREMIEDPRDQDRPSAPDLHRRDRARLRRHRRPLTPRSAPPPASTPSERPARWASVGR